MLVKALSHRSPKGSSLTSKEENRRLGLIGDKLIDLALFEASYGDGSSSKDMDGLRRLKSTRSALNIVMREIDITPHWILNDGTEKRTVEGSKKLGEDTFEAIVGAIFLDKGFMTAKCFVKKYLVIQ